MVDFSLFTDENPDSGRRISKRLSGGAGGDIRNIAIGCQVVVMLVPAHNRFHSGAAEQVPVIIPRFSPDIEIFLILVRRFEEERMMGKDNGDSILVAGSKFILKPFLLSDVLLYPTYFNIDLHCTQRSCDNPSK